MKIYTRTGDKGETSLFSGQRLPKSDPLMDAIGTVDECNCAIGMALSFIAKEPKYAQAKLKLETVQHALFDVGAALATPRTSASAKKIEKTRFDHDATTQLEHWMDEMETELPVLHAFILPGGHPCGATLHLARSICRRAERLVVPFNKQGEVSDNVLCYLNRLSDFLFMASRYINHLSHSPETLWELHKKIDLD